MSNFFDQDSEASIWVARLFPLLRLFGVICGDAKPFMNPFSSHPITML
jgi:hypothetical protein